MTTYYKTLKADGMSPYQNTKYHLPHDGKPGRWMPYLKGKLIENKHGYHVVNKDQLVCWLDARIFVCETRGKVLDWGAKCGFRPIRLVSELTTWNERTQRLFACDCAEHVLGNFENKYPDDDRPRKAIEVARAFANGTATEEELSAVVSAAYSARSAARSAAYSARSAAYSARSAAYSAAYSAERAWQTNRLFEYLDGGDHERRN